MYDDVLMFDHDYFRGCIKPPPFNEPSDYILSLNALQHFDKHLATLDSPNPLRYKSMMILPLPNLSMTVLILDKDCFIHQVDRECASCDAEARECALEAVPS